MATAQPQTPSSPLEGEPNRSCDLVGGTGGSAVIHARNMRKAMTPWEFKLWQHLKNKQLNDLKFRRQQTIGPYIVDFLHTESRLVIELDGSQHAESIRDQKRDGFLMQQGYTVLRFWNNEIDANLEGVLTRILECASRPPHVSPAARPLPLEGGAKGGRQ